MKKHLRKVIVGVIFTTMTLTTIALIAACGNSSNLAGTTWERTFMEFQLTIEFSRNGNLYHRGGASTEEATWEANDGTLLIRYGSSEQMHGTYEIVGSTLFLNGFPRPFGGTWTRS